MVIIISIIGGTLSTESELEEDKRKQCKIARKRMVTKRMARKHWIKMRGKERVEVRKEGKGTKLLQSIRVHLVPGSIAAYTNEHHCYGNPHICRLWNAPVNGSCQTQLWKLYLHQLRFITQISFLVMHSLYVSTSLCVSYLPPLHISLKWVCKDYTHLCAVHSLWSMTCYAFFMGHTANFAIEMDQVSAKISSWTQKYVDISGIFIFEIGPKIRVIPTFRGTR